MARGQRRQNSCAGRARLSRRATGEGEPRHTGTLLTTDVNDTVRPVHNRMPVILPSASLAAWLDPEVKSADALLPHLKPYPAAAMTAVPVSPLVNNPRNDDPGCVAEVTSV